MSITATAYGSITIVDITDIGEFTIYPMSNLPLSVIYDPNDGKYTPNWADKNKSLVLTPVVYYASKALTSSDVRVEWQRQEGTQDAGVLTDGEVSNGFTLTISQNKLSTNESGLLTYICTAYYDEPDSGQTLTAKGQITFSLIKHASKVKKCSITGENVFLYGSDNKPKNTEIVLTANIENTEFNGWQYQTSDGWVDFKDSDGNAIKTTTLTITHNSSIFTSDRVVIRANAEGSIYDICDIVRLRDGTPGDSNIAIVLSNEDQVIPFSTNDNGEEIGNYEFASTTVYIYEGSTDATSDWEFGEPSGTGVVGHWDSSTKTYAVTELTNQTGYVLFTCSKGDKTLTKKFTLTRVMTGKDGVTPVVYSLTSDSLVINRGEAYRPGTVTFSAYSTGKTTESYEGYIRVSEVILDEDGNEQTQVTYNQKSSSYIYTPQEPKLVRVIGQLYDDANTNLLDTQTVVVTNDGAQGEKGDDGEGSINVVLGNQADIIPCNSKGETKAEMIINIPFVGYKGTSKIACDVSVTGMVPDEMECTSTNGTESEKGGVTLKIAKGKKLGGNNSGTLTLTFTCKWNKNKETGEYDNQEVIVHNYQWSKSIQPENAMLLQIYAPDGNTIVNGENNVQLKAQLTDGAAVITDGVEYVWEKYKDGDYNEEAGSGDTITVTPNDVSSYASYQCTAIYDNKPYVANYSVFDKSDPIQVTVHCTLGTQIVNGEGCGAVYTRLIRNGEEIDQLKSEVFSTNDNPSNTNCYYYLNSSDKSVTLRTNDGGIWVASIPSYDYNYKYTFRDKDGNPTTLGENGSTDITSKVFYIDGDLIAKKIVIDVEVSKGS